MICLHFVWSKCILNGNNYSAQKQEFAWNAVKHIDLKTYRSAVKHRSGLI